MGLIPWSGRSLRGGNSNTLQYTCLENSMDRGAWQATVHGVARVRHNWAHIHIFFFNYIKYIKLKFSILDSSLSLRYLWHYRLISLGIQKCQVSSLPPSRWSSRWTQVRWAPGPSTLQGLSMTPYDSTLLKWREICRAKWMCPLAFNDTFLDLCPG